jgi:hypothetical protein
VFVASAEKHRDQPRLVGKEPEKHLKWLVKGVKGQGKVRPEIPMVSRAYAADARTGAVIL